MASSSSPSRVHSISTKDDVHHAPIAHDPLLERRLVRKFDTLVLPLTCILYLFAYLDRSNLGNARLQGLPDDILGGDPTGLLFDWITSIFYISYILFQIPGGILGKLVSPRRWIGAVVMGWGLASSLQAATHNFAGIMTARFFIGIFEAGFGPVLTVYFSYFYTKEEVGFRLALWFGFAAVAGAFGGLIAYGVDQIDSSLAHWRLLFLIEGLPTIVLGAFTFFFLPERPDRSPWLQGAEKTLAIERMSRGLGREGPRTVNKKHIFDALSDWRVYTAGVIYFGLNIALASLSVFLPTIIRDFGYTNARAQILTVPPYAVAAFVMVVLGYITDRVQSRGLFMAATSLIGAIGYLLLLTCKTNNRVRYFATFLSCSGTYATIGLTLAWFSHNLGSETKRAVGIAGIMVIGQCGSVLGSHIYPSGDSPLYIKGLAVCCTFEFLASICCVILSISYRIDNAKRNRIYGEPVAGVALDTTQMADKTPEFRYVP